MAGTSPAMTSSTSSQNAQSAAAGADLLHFPVLGVRARGCVLGKTDFQLGLDFRQIFRLGLEVARMRPLERRRMFFVYLTAGVRTMDLHAAFLNNVNLVVNPSDVDQLPDVLEVSIRHYNELYRDFNRALDMAPI